MRFGEAWVAGRAAPGIARGCSRDRWPRAGGRPGSLAETLRVHCACVAAGRNERLGSKPASLAGGTIRIGDRADPLRIRDDRIQAAAEIDQQRRVFGGVIGRHIDQDPVAMDWRWDRDPAFLGRLPDQAAQGRELSSRSTKSVHAVGSRSSK